MSNIAEIIVFVLYLLAISVIALLIASNPKAGSIMELVSNAWLAF